MPLATSILNLYGYEVIEIESNNPVIIKARYIAEVFCPFCNSDELRKKDTYIRKLNNESIGTRATKLHLKGHKYHCLKCLRYFNQRFPGVLKYKRSTESFRKEVFEKHNNGHTQKYLSDKLRIGTATVERWYHEFLERKVSEMKNNPCPRVIGIDEHFFSRRKGYATTICDLEKHRVFDVILGRSEKSLEKYLNQLRDKHRVQVVVLDLSETYRSIVKKYFPNAKIVSDRFHVIRLINQHFLKLWQQIDPIGRKNRGLLSLMRRHQKNLNPGQVIKLNRYLDQMPELKAIYDFKQDLSKLMLTREQTSRECRKLIPIFLEHIKTLKQSLLDPMVTLGITLESWAEEVVRMWRFTKSNGITEGFHTKMEMISRRAYGFRNFENYRLRVKALCC